jgi:hypothetical protein
MVELQAVSILLQAAIQRMGVRFVIRFLIALPANRVATLEPIVDLGAVPILTIQQMGQ